MQINTILRPSVGADLSRPIHIKLSGHNPTPGRPQGSPLRTTLPPPLQRHVIANALFGVFVRAGVGWMSGWDPCGRPGVGLWPLNLMCMGRDKSAPTDGRSIVLICIIGPYVLTSCSHCSKGDVSTFCKKRLR